MRHQNIGFDAPEIKPLAARQDRDRYFADFRRRKNEFRVWRRLFQRFQKRIERLVRQHVHFVDDIDLVARRGRGIAHAVRQLLHIVNTGMRGRIHLEHIDMARFHDRPAMHALDRHGHGRPATAIRQQIVEPARQNTRRRRFPHPAHAGQNPGLRNSVGSKRVRERLHHRILPDQIVKGLRPVFAGKNTIGGGADHRLCRRRSVAKHRDRQIVPDHVTVRRITHGRRGPRREKSACGR